MIGFARSSEPPEFDQKVRQPGLRFLAENPGKKPHGGYCYWLRVRGELRAAFANLCAYTAMWQSAPGHVDHFVSIDEDRSLAYEWSNYRYATVSINCRKGNCRSCQLLDPFEVQDDWFELLIPSMLLRVTEACPAEVRPRAEFTLKALRLNDDPEIVEFRQEWYRMHCEGEITLEGLDRKAPLIARAIRKTQAGLSRASSA